jgi:hypothetical protein
MRVGSLVFAVAVGGCGSRPDLASIPVVVALDGVQLVQNPCAKHELLVPVEIDGTVGWFVVDSGAYTHVVYEKFARRAKLTLENTGERVGGGVGIPVRKVVPRSFAIPGIAEVAIPELVMLEQASSPLARDTCGVAGVISPALLATPDEALIVDFAAHRLARIPTLDVDARIDMIGGNRFTATRNSNEYTAGIDVAFGARSLRMMVDTGACCTWVTVSSAVGRANLPHSIAGGRVGRLLGTTDSRAARAALRFGDVARTMEIKLLEPDAGDARETGAIGVDALRDCIVAIFETEMRGACR